MPHRRAPACAARRTVVSANRLQSGGQGLCCPRSPCGLVRDRIRQLDTGQRQGVPSHLRDNRAPVILHPYDCRFLGCALDHICRGAWLEIYGPQSHVDQLAFGRTSINSEIIRLIGYDESIFSWLKLASPKVALNTIGYAFFPLGILPSTPWLNSPATLIAVTATLLLILQRVGKYRQELIEWTRENRGAAFALALMISAPIAIWLVSFAKPIFMPRTVLVAIPAWLVAVSLLIGMERKIVGSCVVGLFALALAVTGTARDKPDWRLVASQLSSRVKTGDSILLCPGWQAPAFRHALASRVDVPLYSWRNGKWYLLEQSLGRDKNWEALYFSRSDISEDMPLSRDELGSTGRRWWVSIDCPENLPSVF